MGFDAGKIIVAPNGVTVNEPLHEYGQIDKTDIRKRYGLGDSPVVVFVGNLAYAPNQQALELISSKIAPKVSEQVNNVTFLVIGKTPKETKIPKLVFTGYVKSVRELLNIASVGIAPLLQGSGTRLKILEYFSSSLPVVSTSVGAEGLAVESGREILIEDDLDAFAAHIVRLLKDPSRCTAIGEAAKTVAFKYDWSIIAQTINNQYRTYVFDRKRNDNPEVVQTVKT
jgi:glycosyltransferase involved in cell wall biosynthesis